MAKTKIKDRTRYPCGKLKPETAPPATVRRIINQALRGAANPLLGTEIGRLRLTDVIDDLQLQAADRFADLVGQHDRMHGYARRSVASPSYERGFERITGDAIDEAIVEALLASRGDVVTVAKQEPRVAAALKIARMYRRIDHALSMAGKREWSTVHAVVIGGEIAHAWDQPYLQRGLTVLAVEFGLTNRKQSASVIPT